MMLDSRVNIMVSLMKHRAVAPIIATLLMVAISVVGGILIFVFAQGFFQDTQIASPTIENIEIWGYNATDKTSLGTHAGVQYTTGTQNNKIADGEQFAVFVRNSGGGDVLVSEISVYGVVFNPKLVATTTAIATGSTADKEWTMTTDGTNGCNCQLLVAGQEATIIIDYDSVVNGEIKVGRPIPVKITTGGGATFTKQVISGRDG